MSAPEQQGLGDIYANRASSSALDWIQKQQEVINSRKAEVLQEEREKTKNLHKNGNTSLEGVKVGHNIEDFQEGEEIILTLNRDKGLKKRFLRSRTTDDSDDEDDEDELINENMMEKEYAEENQKATKKSKEPIYDRYAAVENQGQTNSILSHYDDADEDDPIARARARAKRGFLLSSSSKPQSIESMNPISTSDHTLATQLSLLSQPSVSTPQEDLLSQLYGTSSLTQGEAQDQKLKSIPKIVMTSTSDQNDDGSSSLFKKKKRKITNSASKDSKEGVVVIAGSGTKVSSTAEDEDEMEVHLGPTSAELVGSEAPRDGDEAAHLGSRKRKLGSAFAQFSQVGHDSSSNDFMALAQQRAQSLQDASYLKALQRAETETSKLLVNALKSVPSVPKQVLSTVNEMTDIPPTTAATDGSVNTTNLTETLKPDTDMALTSVSSATERISAENDSSMPLLPTSALSTTRLPPGMTRKGTSIQYESSLVQRIAEQRRARQEMAVAVSAPAPTLSEATDETTHTTSSLSPSNTYDSDNLMSDDVSTSQSMSENTGASADVSQKSGRSVLSFYESIVKTEIAAKVESHLGQDEHLFDMSNPTLSVKTEDNPTVLKVEDLVTPLVKSEPAQDSIPISNAVVHEEADIDVDDNDDDDEDMNDLNGHDPSLNHDTGYNPLNPGGIPNDHDWFNGAHRRGSKLALEYAFQHGIFESLSDTKKDGRARDFDVELDTSDGIDLNYYDESGRRLTTKEAQRHLSAKFHGIAPSLNKQEKIRKRRMLASQLIQDRFGKSSTDGASQQVTDSHNSISSKPSKALKKNNEDSAVGVIHAGPQVVIHAGSQQASHQISDATSLGAAPRGKIQVQLTEISKKK